MTQLALHGLPIADVLHGLWNLQVHTEQSKDFAARHGLSDPATWDQVSLAILIPKRGHTRANSQDRQAVITELCAVMGIECTLSPDTRSEMVFDAVNYKTVLPGGAQAVIDKVEKLFHERCSPKTQ